MLVGRALPSADGRIAGGQLLQVPVGRVVGARPGSSSPTSVTVTASRRDRLSLVGSACPRCWRPAVRRQRPAYRSSDRLVARRASRSLGALLPRRRRGRDRPAVRADAAYTGPAVRMGAARERARHRQRARLGRSCDRAGSRPVFIGPRYYRDRQPAARGVLLFSSGDADDAGSAWVGAAAERRGRGRAGAPRRTCGTSGSCRSTAAPRFERDLSSPGTAELLVLPRRQRRGLDRPSGSIVADGRRGPARAGARRASAHRFASPSRSRAPPAALPGRRHRRARDGAACPDRLQAVLGGSGLRTLEPRELTTGRLRPAARGVTAHREQRLGRPAVTRRAVEADHRSPPRRSHQVDDPATCSCPGWRRRRRDAGRDLVRRRATDGRAASPPSAESASATQGIRPGAATAAGNGPASLSAPYQPGRSDALPDRQDG